MGDSSENSSGGTSGDPSEGFLKISSSEGRASWVSILSGFGSSPAIKFFNQASDFLPAPKVGPVHLQEWLVEKHRMERKYRVEILPRPGYSQIAENPDRRDRFNRESIE